MSYSPAELVRRYKISPTRIVHVGAWEGADVPEYKALGISEITLVEAMPDKASSLRKQYGHDHQIQIIEAAASDTSGETVKFYPLGYGSSSLLKPKIESLQHVFADFIELEPITVETMRMDDLENSEIDKVMLIIDVQGAELKVLQGSLELLKKTVLLKVEVSTTTYYVGQSYQRDVTLFLRSKGFIKVSQRISRKMGQGDAIFLRKGCIPTLSFFLGQLMDLRWRLSIQKLNSHAVGSLWRRLQSLEPFRAK
jgi:FkbM family methyltransferase